MGNINNVAVELSAYDGSNCVPNPLAGTVYTGSVDCVLMRKERVRVSSDGAALTMLHFGENNLKQQQHYIATYRQHSQPLYSMPTPVPRTTTGVPAPRQSLAAFPS